MENNTLILLLDEPEVRFQANYARKFIKSLLDILKVSKWNNLNYQIFISTHSPFILSDIESRDIILLENGVQKKEIFDTFASNIHTLLKNSFFLDTPMGEFAKEQIDCVYAFLSNNSYTGDMNKGKAYRIISIIGEPIIKKKLLTLFYKKFDVDKDKQIHNLKNEISQLKSKININQLDVVESELNQLLEKIRTIKNERK